MPDPSITSQINYQRSIKPETPLWSYRVNPKMKISLYIVIIVSVLLLIVALLGLYWDELSPESISDFFQNITLLFVLYSGIVTYLYTGSYMVYSILPDRICFEWGIFKRKKVEIPLTDITTIQLVTYTDRETATIHFGTKSDYKKLKKFDYENHDTRPHITFEKVKNGQEVYELLQSLKNKTGPNIYE